MDSVVKPRGRPRRYDAETALARARDVFWQAGYAATSLDDLAVAMGMHRPSIYAGFGDKRALYRAAVDRYAADSRRWLARELAGPGPLRDRLRTVYRNAAASYRTGGASPRGCFLVGTAVTEATGDEHVRATVDATFEAFTDLFAARFQRAAAERDLTSPSDPRGLGQIACAALNTLALRIRTAADDDVIEALIDATLNAICGRD